ncbi:MAG: hypothetical protein ABI721_05705 [Candidatus Dojkabacteria bacterium]
MDSDITNILEQANRSVSQLIVNPAIQADKIKPIQSKIQSMANEITNFKNDLQHRVESFKSHLQSEVDAIDGMVRDVQKSAGL